MGSGLPIAAVVGKAKIMDAAIPGTIGGTYIGSPVCCAAALATIKYMKDINLNEKANHVGEIVTNRIHELQKKVKAIGDIRGVGAMIGIEFVKDGNPNSPDTELCTKVVKGCSDEGLILLSAGTHKNVIRILSPLVITDEELNRGLDILENQILKHTQSTTSKILSWIKN
jgi:4-aminobutyrate aminotransferase/(S)-3-amino-2-methylpropionate transaminase